MKTQHTKGPWILNGFTIEAHCPDQDNGGYKAPICELDEGWSNGASEANARLIAAAPELLEALIETNDIFNDHFNITDEDDPGNMTHERIRIAIAKATGNE